jgi:DNA-binding transcriptional LysR family regulator
VQPTIYARTLLKRADVVFDELRQGVREIEFLANPAAGVVTVGCPESLAAGFVPAVIDRLSRRYPDVLVNVIAAQPGEQEFRELRERTVDVLLGRLFKPVIADDIDAETLCEDGFFVTAGADTPWARRRKISLRELIAEHWVLFPPGTLSGEYIEAGFRTHGLPLPTRQLSSFSMQLRFHLLGTGRFLTVLHHSVLHFNARRWSLKALPIDLIHQPMPITLFSLRNRTLSPVVALFTAEAREVARSITPWR